MSEVAHSGEVSLAGDLTELMVGMSSGELIGEISPEGVLLLIQLGCPEWDGERISFPMAVRMEG